VLGAWCFPLAVCLAQRQPDVRPPPLNPVQAEREARALITELLAPQPPLTNTGLMKIRDTEGKERSVPVRFEIISTPTNWLSVFETTPTNNKAAAVKLTVLHPDNQPNQYLLLDPARTGAAPGAPRTLTGNQTMIPFAGSDFWLADLGLEFLHWPKQRLLRKELRRSQSCDVLESINPDPPPRGYARIVSWITIDAPHGIVHADAYDSGNEVIKRFDPKKLEKIQGEYQLESMEIRTRKTDTRTLIEFNLKPLPPPR